MLRDRLVCGVRDPQLQKRLLAERQLTFSKALELAQAFESAESSSRDIQAVGIKCSGWVCSLGQPCCSAASCPGGCNQDSP